MTSKEIGLYLRPEHIQKFAAGEKLVFCEPKQQVEKNQAGLVQKRLVDIGKVMSAVDVSGVHQFDIKLADAFVTTFGDPDKRLIEGMKFTDKARFQKVYGGLRQMAFSEDKFTDQTELFVTIWEKA